MISKHTLSILFTLFCHGMVATVMAQPQSNVRFSTLSLSGEIEEIYFDDASGTPVELKAVDYVRSPFYEVRANAPLRVYRLLPPEEGESEPRRELVGSINWPSHSGPFLLMIGQRGEEYSFSVVPDDSSTFPLGSFRVYNASELPVVIQVGDTRALLEPRESKVLKPDLDQEGRGALFQVAARVGDKPRLVYSNLWSGSKTQRTLVFILNRDNPRAPIGLKRLHESDLVLRRKNNEFPSVPAP